VVSCQSSVVDGYAVAADTALSLGERVASGASRVRGFFAMFGSDPCSGRNRPLTRPAPAGEGAGRGTPSPWGEGRDSIPCHFPERDAVNELEKWRKNYRPSTVIALMCAIKPMAVEAICKAGLSHVPLYVTPFPSHGNQKRFRAKMAEIMPKILNRE
jgi:hypothetical protein